MAVATGREYGLFIDGGMAEPASGEVLELLEPATGESLARAAMAGDSDVDRAVDAARAALDGRLVWIANPLDAFTPADQRLYLDWIAGRESGDSLPAAFPAVLVTADTPPAERLSGRGGWRVAARDERAVLFVRSRS